MADSDHSHFFTTAPPTREKGLPDIGLGLPSGAKCDVDTDCASGKCPACIRPKNVKNMKPWSSQPYGAFTAGDRDRSKRQAPDTAMEPVKERDTSGRPMW